MEHILWYQQRFLLEYFIYFPSDAITSSNGAQIAYGEGSSISGLSFMPVVGILLVRRQIYTSSSSLYYGYIGIKGCGGYTGVMIEDNDNAESIKCTFGDNSVSFGTSYNSYIAAIGY